MDTHDDGTITKFSCDIRNALSPVQCAIRDQAIEVGTKNFQVFGDAGIVGLRGLPVDDLQRCGRIGDKTPRRHDLADAKQPCEWRAVRTNRGRRHSWAQCQKI